MKSLLRRLRSIFGFLAAFLPARRLSYLAALAFFSLVFLAVSGTERRTFVFRSVENGTPTVEIRMLPRTGDEEAQVRRYVEESLLGPASVKANLLFSRGTRIESFMLRKGVAYVDLSQDAAFPAEGERDVRRGVSDLSSGIRRNFRDVRNVRIFIHGNEAYAENFVPVALEAHEKK